MDSVFIGSSPYKKLHKEYQTPPSKRHMLEFKQLQMLHPNQDKGEQSLLTDGDIF